MVGESLDQNKVWILSHGPANKLFLWAPPPALADAALEELSRLGTREQILSMLLFSLV